MFVIIKSLTNSLQIIQMKTILKPSYQAPPFPYLCVRSSHHLIITVKIYYFAYTRTQNFFFPEGTYSGELVAKGISQLQNAIYDYSQDNVFIQLIDHEYCPKQDLSIEPSEDEEILLTAMVNSFDGLYTLEAFPLSYEEYQEIGGDFQSYLVDRKGLTDAVPFTAKTLKPLSV